MQTTIKWHYMKRGCFRERGVASYERLQELARSGSLEEADLIYGEKTSGPLSGNGGSKLTAADLIYGQGTGGRWVRADSIPSLFGKKTETKRAAAPAPSAIHAARRQPASATLEKTPEQQKTVACRAVFLAALCLALLANIAWLVISLASKDPPPLPPPSAGPASTNLRQTVEADADERSVSAYPKPLDPLHTECQMPEKGIVALPNFAKAHADAPDAPDALLELAALLSLQGKTDEAIACLKKAVQAGGEPVRKRAREDPRFDAIRDNWTFIWQTRTSAGP